MAASRRYEFEPVVVEVGDDEAVAAAAGVVGVDA